MTEEVISGVIVGWAEEVNGVKGGSGDRKGESKAVGGEAEEIHVAPEVTSVAAFEGGVKKVEEATVWSGIREGVSPRTEREVGGIGVWTEVETEGTRDGSCCCCCCCCCCCRRPKVGCRIGWWLDGAFCSESNK